MTTGSLIDAIVREYDIPTTGADIAAVRLKLLDKANEASDEAWLHFDGEDFQCSSTTVNLAQGASSVAAPTDFYKAGSDGGVFIQVAADDIRRLTYLPPGELREALKENGTQTGIPESYSVWAMDGVTDLIPEFHFDTIANAAYTIQVDYVMTPPVLTDATTTASNLHIWPVMYHNVILKGTLARGARVLGDSQRQPQHEAEFQRVLALARSTRVHGQDDNERIGRAGYSAYRAW